MGLSSCRCIILQLSWLTKGPAVKNSSLGSGQIRSSVLVIQPAVCMPWNKTVFKTPKPQFPHLQNGNADDPSLTGHPKDEMEGGHRASGPHAARSDCAKQGSRDHCYKRGVGAKHCGSRKGSLTNSAGGGETVQSRRQSHRSRDISTGP